MCLVTFICLYTADLGSSFVVLLVIAKSSRFLKVYAYYIHIIMLIFIISIFTIENLYLTCNFCTRATFLSNKNPTANSLIPLLKVNSAVFIWFYHG